MLMFMGVKGGVAHILVNQDTESTWLEPGSCGTSMILTQLLPPARCYILKIPGPSKHHQQLASRHSKPHKHEGTVREPEGNGSASDPDTHTEELGCVVHWIEMSHFPKQQINPHAKYPPFWQHDLNKPQKHQWWPGTEDSGGQGVTSEWA